MPSWCKIKFKSYISCNEVSNWSLNKLDGSESDHSLLYCIHPIKCPEYSENGEKGGGGSYYVCLLCIFEEIWDILYGDTESVTVSNK